MDGQISIHNVPPQSELPARGAWQKKQQQKRKPATPAPESGVSEDESAIHGESPETGEAPPQNRDVGSQIDIEA